MLTNIHTEFMQQELDKLKAVIQRYQLTADSIEALCLAPALTKENVQAYLNECSKEELAQFFFTAGLVKLAETVEGAQARHESTSSVSPNQSAHPGGSSEALPDDGKP